MKGFIRMRSVVGTVWYMAPEVYGHSYTEKCDIWSAGINWLFFDQFLIGVMLYIMLCGYPPFYGENKQDIRDKVIKGVLEFDGKHNNQTYTYF